MITKTTMVVIFNSQNSHLLTLSLPTVEVFQVNGQNRLGANLPVVDFHSRTREMLTPRPLNTQLSVFIFHFFRTDYLSLKIIRSLSVFANLALISRFTRITFNWKQGIVG